RRHDLFALREGWLLVDVDDLQLVPPLEVLVADDPQVVHGARRSGGHAGDEQAEDVLPSHRLTRRSSPTRTRSVFERSPMIFLIGSGSRRTSVGTARIWSPRASCGFCRRSIISIS